jgi:signal transduction histidine kinase
MMAKMLGVKVELSKNKSWTEYMAMLKGKKLDVLINIIDIESRHDFAAFTSPFAEISTFAASRKNEFSAIISKDILVNKRIAITKGYAINEQLKESLPRSTFIEVINTVEALELISSNQADVYLEAGAVLDYFITKNMIPNVQLFPVSADLEVVNQKFSIATHKDNKTLLSILQKTMNAIPDIEHIRLKRKWFGTKTARDKERERFTKSELEFVNNSELTLCRPALGGGSTRVIQLIDLITQNIGLNINMSRPLVWSDSLKALKNKECDILLQATPTKERERFYNFTPSYNRNALAVMTKKDKEKIVDIFDHLSEPFGIVKGSSSIELLKKHYPKIKLIEARSTREGVELLQKGKVFAYIYSSNFANAMLKNNKFSRLKINTHLREKFDDVQAIATNKDNILLHSILTKALANTDKDKIEQIIKNVGADHLDIKMSSQELSLLKNKEMIWCLSSDYKTWEELIPYLANLVNMKVIKSDVFSWDDALRSLENGSCDFLPAVTPTKAREKIMAFTPSIHKEERVIVTTSDHKFISNIEDYLEQTFAVVKGDIIVEQLKSSYPNIKLVEIEHELDGLQLVQKKEIFAYIASISVMSHAIRQYALENLKISGSLSDKFMDDWTIATRKENVLLSSIFSKIIESVDKKELRKKLFNQYSVKYEKVFDYTLFWQMLFIVLVILIAIVFWNRRLSALNNQLILSKKVAEQAQQKVESQNREILSTQQQLIQSEKMASLGTLTAGVAHEINNPTNFTYAAVFMMQNEIDDIKRFLKHLAGGDNADVDVINSFDTKFEKLIKLAKTASEGTQRIKIIVEDLRTFARLDDAKQANVKVSELITSTVHLVQTQFESITINTDFSFNPTLLCFPSKLNQVFMNIIVNACQSIKTKLKQNHQLNSNKEFEGLITISTSRDNEHLVIHIEDNGCGMDEQTKQKVCEPFFTTKDVGSGTGLGMAISFGIIEEHDGMLKILSTYSQGSNFLVYLPLDNNSSDNKS